MGLFWKKKKEKIEVKEEPKKENLDMGMVGGEVTPSINLHPVKLPEEKLLNRLSIINAEIKRIKDLPENHPSKNKLRQWEKNKFKVKSLLQIYYDIEVN